MVLPQADRMRRSVSLHAGTMYIQSVGLLLHARTALGRLDDVPREGASMGGEEGRSRRAVGRVVMGGGLQTGEILEGDVAPPDDMALRFEMRRAMLSDGLLAAGGAV